jgi:POT family proton-dependent oligopeptide transporter
MFRQRHPPGLYVLFVSEMWERFSFYCMAAVFMLYMTWEGNGHPFLQQNASLINGCYFGTIYFTPFFGGLLADRRWGYRLTIVVGGLIMGLGHIFLAVAAIWFFFAGLTALVIGCGMFKPNISTLVGKLYPANDPRLDRAYTIFYMGINVGAFTAPLVASFMMERYGFHAAFGIASVGMALAVLIFLSCHRWLVFTDYRQADARPADDEQVPAELQSQRHLALLIIFVIVSLFWMALMQGSNTLVLWFRDCTDREAPTWWPGSLSFLLDKDGNFSAALSNSMNPFFVIALSPLMVWIWGFLRRQKAEPATPAKMVLGMVLTAAAFSILMIAGLRGGDHEGVRVSVGYLLSAFAVVTCGELCLSPIGLSLVSKLAAPSQRSTWMGGWFVATSVGTYLSGLLGDFWNTWRHSAFFGVLVASSLVAAVLLLVFYRSLARAMPVPAQDSRRPEGKAVRAVFEKRSHDALQNLDPHRRPQ